MERPIKRMFGGGVGGRNVRCSAGGKRKKRGSRGGGDYNRSEKEEEGKGDAIKKALSVIRKGRNGATMPRKNDKKGGSKRSKKRKSLLWGRGRGRNEEAMLNISGKGEKKVVGR